MDPGADRSRGGVNGEVMIDRVVVEDLVVWRYAVADIIEVLKFPSCLSEGGGFTC